MKKKVVSETKAWFDGLMSDVKASKTSPGGGSKSLVLELERLNTALETAGNSLAEVKAQMELERQGKGDAETKALNLQKELDTLRRSNAELERVLESYDGS